MIISSHCRYLANDSATKRSTVRQNGRQNFNIAISTFCCTVAISPTTVRQKTRQNDNTGDSISMSLSLPFCRTVALSCVLSHYRSLSPVLSHCRSLPRFVALSLSSTRQIDKMGEKATVRQKGRERQCDKTGERATVSVTKRMREGQCDKKWRDGDNELLSHCRQFCRSLVRFVALSLSRTFCCSVACRAFCRTVVGEIATVRNILYHPP